MFYQKLKLFQNQKNKILDLPYGYSEVYLLKIKNSECEYFIGKNYKSDIYEFKIFKYDV